MSACFGTLIGRGHPSQPGALFGLGYVVADCAFSVPAVVVGFASASAGLLATASVDGIVVIGLSLLALVAHPLRSAHNLVGVCNAAAARPKQGAA